MMEKSNLIKILHGNIDLIDKVNVYDVALFSDNTVIYPHDVKHMLLEFLIGRYNADDLQKWAMFITLRGEYITPGNAADTNSMDYYETMYYVIQRLSTPEIDGEITKERVKGYLAELFKYGNE